MANGQQDPRDLDEVWNDFMEARIKLLQSMLDFVHAAQKAFDGHIWIAFGYPEGMKGWAAYCRNNFSQQASIMRQLPKSDRRQLLLEAKSTGFSDRTVAQILDAGREEDRHAHPPDGRGRPALVAMGGHGRQPGEAPPVIRAGDARLH